MIRIACEFTCDCPNVARAENVHQLRQKGWTDIRPIDKRQIIKKAMRPADAFAGKPMMTFTHYGVCSQCAMAEYLSKMPGTVKGATRGRDDPYRTD